LESREPSLRAEAENAGERETRPLPVSSDAVEDAPVRLLHLHWFANDDEQAWQLHPRFGATTVGAAIAAARRAERFEREYWCLEKKPLGALRWLMRSGLLLALMLAASSSAASDTPLTIDQLLAARVGDRGLCERL
jgi:hypothetical protein